MASAIRIGVIGHVEHITVGRVPKVPGPGDIAHIDSPVCIPGGGGGIAFFQLANSPAEIHLFTAIGDDDAGEFVMDAVSRTGAHIHAAGRCQPHTRDLVMIDPSGERAIAVVGEPLHPNADDALPWSLLSELDAVYFTAQDARLLRLGRNARLLVATARRQPSINEAGVRLDAVIGSRSDPREVCARSDYDPPPDALIMTEGARGGVVETARGQRRFDTVETEIAGGAYGAGDSFAGAFVYYLAAGNNALEAAARAAAHGAAVLADINPLAAQRPL